MCFSTVSYTEYLFHYQTVIKFLSVSSIVLFNNKYVYFKKCLSYDSGFFSVNQLHFQYEENFLVDYTLKLEKRKYERCIYHTP